MRVEQEVAILRLLAIKGRLKSIKIAANPNLALPGSRFPLGRRWFFIWNKPGDGLTGLPNNDLLTCRYTVDEL